MKLVCFILFLLFIPIADAEIISINGTSYESNWNSSSMVATKEWNVSNPDKYPYKFVNDDSVNWLFYRDDDSFSLSKSIFDVINPRPHNIGFEIRTTKAGVVSKSQVNGSGLRRIKIPKPITQRRFLFNDRMVVIIDNGSSQWEANSSTYWFSRVGGITWFNFMTAEYQSLNASDMITFKSDSYAVFNGSTSPPWQNTTLENKTLTGNNDNNIVIGIGADYANRADSASLGNSWWESIDTWNFITSKAINMSLASTASNGIIFQNVSLSAQNYTINFRYINNDTTNEDQEIDIQFYRNSYTNYTTPLPMIRLREDNDYAYTYWTNGSIANSGERWYDAVGGVGLINSPNVTLVISCNNVSIYSEGVYQGYLDNWGSSCFSGTIGFTGALYGKGIRFNNVRFSNTISGNSTHNYSFPAGRQVSQYRVNFTNASGIYLDSYTSADNITYNLAMSNVTNATLLDFPSGDKVQNSFLRFNCKANTTATCETMEVTITDEAVSGNGVSAGNYPIWNGWID